MGRRTRRNKRHHKQISGPPTLVKQDVKVSSSKAIRERGCALAVAAGRTNLSELARLIWELRPALERAKTKDKSTPPKHQLSQFAGAEAGNKKVHLGSPWNAALTFKKNTDRLGSHKLVA